MDLDKMREGLALFLEGANVPDEDAYTADTPRIASEAWAEEVLAGYRQDPGQILTPVYSEEYHDIVLLRDVPFTSICSHHLLPFKGSVSLGYIPNGKITGLSRLARLVDCYARRLQSQERMTHQITQALVDHLDARGAACVVRSEQFCLCSVGPKKEGATTVTAAFRGMFEDDPVLRQSFLHLISEIR